jgi:UDP-GlcNAc:undecaprenyl-phosphate GlcNAc-1-phosphate transferase
MPDTTIQIILGFVVSFLLSYVLTYFANKLAVKYGFIDLPTRSHPAILHQVPIARAGGLGMFIAFSVVSLFMAHIDPLLLGLIIGGLLNVIIGTLDDKYNISPLIRLGVQILSGVIIVLSGVSFYIGNPFNNHVLYFDQFSIHLPWSGLTPEQFLVLPADLILIFWVVWLMNTANWGKGVGQLPGVAGISFITLGLVALKFQAGNPYQLQTALLAFISAGAVLAFVPFNFPPEKMFPGFGGSTFIGFNLAVLAILSGGKIATLLIVFAIPMIDALLVGTKRILTGHNPLIHDREHLYHFLLDAGFTKRHIIIFYWLTALIFGLTSLFLDRTGKIVSIAALLVIIGSFFVFLYWRKRHGTT